MEGRAGPNELCMLGTSASSGLGIHSLLWGVPSCDQPPFLSASSSLQLFIFSECLFLFLWQLPEAGWAQQVLDPPEVRGLTHGHLHVSWGRRPVLTQPSLLSVPDPAEAPGPSARGSPGLRDVPGSSKETHQDSEAADGPHVAKPGLIAEHCLLTKACLLLGLQPEGLSQLPLRP